MSSWEFVQGTGEKADEDQSHVVLERRANAVLIADEPRKRVKQIQGGRFFKYVLSIMSGGEMEERVVVSTIFAEELLFWMLPLKGHRCDDVLWRDATHQAFCSDSEFKHCETSASKEGRCQSKQDRDTFDLATRLAAGNRGQLNQSTQGSIIYTYKANRIPQ